MAALAALPTVTMPPISRAMSFAERIVDVDDARPDLEVGERAAA